MGLRPLSLDVGVVKGPVERHLEDLCDSKSHFEGRRVSVRTKNHQRASLMLSATAENPFLECIAGEGPMRPQQLQRCPQFHDLLRIEVGNIRLPENSREDSLREGRVAH